jgi:hypothetical protein
MERWKADGKTMKTTTAFEKKKTLTKITTCLLNGLFVLERDTKSKQKGKGFADKNTEGQIIFISVRQSWPFQATKTDYIDIVIQ